MALAGTTPLDIAQFVFGIAGLGEEQRNSEERIKLRREAEAEGEGLLRANIKEQTPRIRGVESEFGRLEGQTLSALDQIKRTGFERIGRGGAASLAAGQQSLIDRGLGSRLTADAQRIGVGEASRRATEELEEQVQGLKIDARERLRTKGLQARFQSIGAESALNSELANAVFQRADVEKFNAGFGASQIVASLRPAPTPESPKDNSILTAGIGGGALITAAAIT